MIHERLLQVAPPPAILKFLHVRVTLSSSLFLKSFMWEPLFSINSLSQRQKHVPKETSSLPLPLHIFMYVFVSHTQSMSLFCRLSSHFSVFSICGSVWPSERSMPMWLSSPQGTVQVSRLRWRTQAPCVTNAFGWSAGPQGTLFQSSVGTWQQSPQELFKWEKLYQSQLMLLHAHPSLLNHTFKTRWSSLSASFCYSCVFHSSAE